jgi:ABC-type antimicrobial peptide transport system permease subunit
MKTLGATSAMVRRLIVTEALVTSAMSWAVAVTLSLPLSFGVESLLGTLGFLAPLPFVVSGHSMLAWLGLLGVATLGAAMPPVRRATAMSVREALAEA